MSSLMENNSDIRETHERYEQFTKDEELRDMYEARMKLLRDYNQGLHTGFKQGIEKGAYEKAVKTATVLKKLRYR